jgi:putative Mn2+ efflux pump MntP
MDNYQKLTKRVMRRVYGLWFLRQMAPALVGMPALSAVAFWHIGRTFFVAKIFENFTNSLYSGNILTITNFVGSALYHCSEHFLALAIAGFSAGLVIILGYKLIRNFTRFTLVRI